MTAELVGPLPTIGFYDGTRLAYEVPRSTMDPRFKACHTHRPACDCREAEMAEQIAELRSELNAIRRAAREVLAGHPTWAWEDGPYGEREVGCACTGCTLVRASDVGLLSMSEAGPSARDEVDGLSDWDWECDVRWQVCTTPSVKQPCAKVVTRDRGHYHEHKVSPGGSLAWLSEFDPMNECPF